MPLFPKLPQIRNPLLPAQQEQEGQVNPLLQTEQAQVVGEAPIQREGFKATGFGQEAPVQREQVEAFQFEAPKPTGAPVEPPPSEVPAVTPTEAPTEAVVFEAFPADPTAFAEPTKGAIQQGDVDSVLRNMLTNMQDFFAGFDFEQLGAEMQTYLQQLMTGQTEATRALQAQEAAAMAQGVTNLMNNISASAANAGITGTALSQFYNQGLQQVGQMMGNFAMDNIARMADTQAKGFQGVMDMFKLSNDQQRQWLSAYTDWKQFQTGDEQWNKTFGWNALQTIANAAAEDPAIGVLYSNLLTGLEQGKSIPEILSSADIATLSSVVAEGQTMTDVAAEVKYIQDELGFKALVTQRRDDQGNLVFKKDGSPVWDVSIATEIDPNTGELTMVPYTATGATPDTPIAPEQVVSTLSTMNSAKWDRLSETQQSSVNDFLIGEQDATTNADIRNFSRDPDGTTASNIENGKMWVSTPDGEPGYLNGDRSGVGTGVAYNVYNMDGILTGYIFIAAADEKVGNVRSWRKDLESTVWRGEFTETI